MNYWGKGNKDTSAYTATTLILLLLSVRVSVALTSSYHKNHPFMNIRKSFGGKKRAVGLSSVCKGDLEVFNRDNSTISVTLFQNICKSIIFPSSLFQHLLQVFSINNRNQTMGTS